MKKAPPLINILILFLFLFNAISLSACAKNTQSESTDLSPENMVTEYRAEIVGMSDRIGSALRFCASDDFVYILGDGSGEDIIARYDISNSSWSGINGIDPGYIAVNISSYSNKLWALLQNGNGGYALCTIEDNNISEAMPFDIPFDTRISGFYVYSEGALLWNYSQLYLCDSISGNTIKAKQLSATWTLNGISVGSTGVYAQVNRNSENVLINVEDLFTGANTFINYNSDPALVPICVSSHDYYLISEVESLMSYDINNATYSKLLSWADMGCSTPDLIPAVIECADETIFFLDRYTGNLIQITPQLVPARTTITIATSINNSILNDLVYQFNQSNSQYKVEVEMYSANDIDRLRTKIIAGNGPDIIDTISLPMAGEANGYYENLLPYLENDAEISVEDYLPSIFAASKIDGALYYIMPSFDVHAVAVPGVYQSMVYSFDEYQKNFTEATNIEVSTGMGATDILQTAFPVIQSDIIFTQNDGKFINTELLKQWLAFCTEAVNYQISFETISNCRRVAAITKNFGGEASFIGLPSQNSNGVYATPSYMCFAMLSTGEHKDAAWGFMRQLLMPIYQDNVAPFGFPVMTQSLEAIIQDALDDEENSFSERDAQRLRSLLNSVDVAFFYDNTLKDLVSADASAYFSGQRSLDDVVSLIESKVNIYLGERS